MHREDVLAVGGFTSTRSSRGSFTATRSRAGFGVTPAKSSTIANVASVFRIDSRAAPAAMEVRHELRDVRGRDRADAPVAEHT